MFRFREPTNQAHGTGLEEKQARGVHGQRPRDLDDGLGGDPVVGILRAETFQLVQKESPSKGLQKFWETSTVLRHSQSPSFSYQNRLQALRTPRAFQQLPKASKTFQADPVSLSLPHSLPPSLTHSLTLSLSLSLSLSLCLLSLCTSDRLSVCVCLCVWTYPLLFL